MELKSYQTQRINEYGDTENCYLTFEGMSFDWDTKSLFASFKNYKSPEEALRGMPSRQAFVLTLKNNDLMTNLVTQIPENERDDLFLEIFSNRIWNIAETTAFIPDYSEINEENQRVKVLKSLTDLNAQLITITL